MKQKILVWLTNAEDILRYEGYSPSFTTCTEQQADYYNRQGYIQLAEVEVEVTIPSLETLRTKTIEGLREQIAKTRADAHVQEKDLEQRINDLLLIGHDNT